MRRLINQSQWKLYTHSIFFNSTCQGAVYDVNEGKGILQIIDNYLIHDIWLPNTRAVNDYHSLLKWRNIIDFNFNFNFI